MRFDLEDDTYLMDEAGQFFFSVDPNYSPSTPEPATPPPNEACDSPGTKPNPNNCHEYYTCTVMGGNNVGEDVLAYGCRRIFINDLCLPLCDVAFLAQMLRHRLFSEAA